MKEPELILPKDWSNLQIALTITGGIGDVLMTIGGSAKALKQKPCTVTAFVRDHQKTLVSDLIGVDSVERVEGLNYPGIRRNFDVIVNFQYTFNCRGTLIDCDYYKAVTKRLGIPVSVGNFNFDTKNGEHLVALHPGASNPNRRWSNDNWRSLALALLDRGFRIYWLGTSDEFGFNALDCTKLSDISEDLEFQAKKLSECFYFIGNDSGFAHIAGLLDIRGAVLFGNTLPDNVIGQYPKLYGIHHFAGIIPTRSLDPEDETSLKCMGLITVDDVLQVSGFNAFICTRTVTETIESHKHKVGVVGKKWEADRLACHLMHWYNVQRLDSRPLEIGDYTAIVEITDKTSWIHSCRGKVSVSISNSENVRRAIRELTA